ncbi:hypothetical protein RSAG8_13035, partial [Rhizoctonia solani AG-8 WAC10335]
MYIEALIVQALLNDRNWHGCVGWFESFHRQISRAQANTVEADVLYLADRLSALQDLSLFVSMLLNSSSSYLLLRTGVPLFLQLAASYPRVWTRDSAVLISHALAPIRHEMAKFVFTDTISALAFGIAPLLDYDTTVREDELETGMNWRLE